MQNKRIGDNVRAFLFFFWRVGGGGGGQIGTKNISKFIVEPSFFTSWTITSEKCTRAHLQENK